MNDILMYGEIGFGNLVDTEFITQLAQSNGQETRVRLNSPGGDVFQGLAIYNAIKEHGQCDIYIDGLAASMASIIMLAGRRIFAAKNAMIMIHNPSVGGYEGDSKKLKATTQLLDKVKQLAIESYSERTGLSNEELTTMLDNETWLTAQEALEQGFIDEIINEVLETKSTISQKAKTPKMIFMNYKTKKETTPKSLTVILGIANNSSPEIILRAISSLKDQNILLIAENNRIKMQVAKEQKEEAEKLTLLAIEKGVLNKNLKAIQMIAFESNFKKTKQDLLMAINEVTSSSVMLENHKLIKSVVLGSKKGNGSHTKDIDISKDKPKSEWTLQDYRKLAPKELENDRELYNKLLKEEFKN